MTDKITYIREYMKENGISIEDLSKQTGVTRRFIQDISNGYIESGKSQYKPEGKKCIEYGDMIYEAISKESIVDDIDISNISDKDNYSKEELEELLDDLKETAEQVKIERTKKSIIQGIDRENIKKKAQYELLMEEIKTDLTDIGEKKYIQQEKSFMKSSKDQVQLISDWHIGQMFNSPFGSYNFKIAINRVNELYNNIIEIRNTHKTENIHVVCLGDLIQGDIHDIFNITNEFPVTKQVVKAAELITELLVKLSSEFNNVYVYSIVGNHSRRKPEKDKSDINDYMDEQIMDFVSIMLKHIDNIIFIPYTHPAQAHFRIKHTNFMAIHGDTIKIGNERGANKLFTQAARKFGVITDVILAGHLHYPSVQEYNGLKVIQAGCLPGSGDDYTTEKGLISNPSQTALVLDDNGIVCSYIIEFKK